MWAKCILSLSKCGQGSLRPLLCLGDYFGNIQHFVLPINDFTMSFICLVVCVSIMIGQFTSRFVGGMKTYQVLLAMMVFPSSHRYLVHCAYYYSATG